MSRRARYEYSAGILGPGEGEEANHCRTGAGAMKAMELSGLDAVDVTIRPRTH
jgi:hypothetical protein